MISQADLAELLPNLGNSGVLVIPSADPNYLLISYCTLDITITYCQNASAVLVLDPLAIREIAVPEADEYRLKWSPDGTMLVAYNPRSGSATNLYVFDREGAMLVRHRIVGHSGDPFWTPDSSQLIWNQNGIIHAMNADGSSEHELAGVYSGDAWYEDILNPPSPECLTYSPSGDRIAYTDTTGLFVFTAAPDFSDPRPIVVPTDPVNTSDDTTYGDCSSEWSPDGDYLLLNFSSTCQGGSCTSHPAEPRRLLVDMVSEREVNLDEYLRSSRRPRLCGFTPDSSIALRDEPDLIVLSPSSGLSHVIPGFFHQCPFAWYGQYESLPPSPYFGQGERFAIPSPTVAPRTPPSDPVLYDDFNSPDPLDDRWSSSLADPDHFSFVKEGGSLQLASTGSPMDSGFEVWMAQPDGRSISQVQVYEASLTLITVTEGFGLVSIEISADVEGGWSAGCSTRFNTSDPGPFIRCGGDDNGETEYVAPYAFPVLGEPNTLRIELDPNTAVVRFYVNGQAQGAYSPSRASALLNAQFAPSISVWGFAGTRILAEADDVFISQ